jgi:hypothetical protein
VAAFVSNTTGVASRSVTVPAGTDRLLVAVALYGSTNAAQSATYGGVAMSVASNANGFVQIFYMLNPPAGSATLAVTGSSVDTVVAAHYTGVGSFQSGQQASVASASFSPNAGGVIVFGMEATSTSHTPLAGTNERLDSAGTYYADRIVSSSGSVTVGVSTATGPDYAGAIFLDSVNASGTPTAPSPAGSGAASAGTSASGTPTAPSPAGSGSVAITVSASGTPTAPSPAGSGTPAVVVSASGAATAPHPTALGAESLAPVSVSGAVSAIVPSASGSAVRLGGIQCDHPRPKLDLPGYTPPRLAWQPPAYLPPTLEGLQRAVKESLQGIYNELLKAAARRNVVPLIDDINAREGQVITGVADGQVITMPIPTPGQLGQVTVIVTDVISPATIVNPDGSTLTLDQPGTYQIATGPGETSWQPPPGVSSSGSSGGAGYFVDATHASLPNARVGTTSTEVTVDITTPHVVSFALRTASVVLAKLQNLAGLSLLARAANSSGVMAALTATGGGQYFRSNAGGTSLEVADPASTSIVNTTGQLQRAALTGDVTAAQNSNATTIAAHAVTLGKMAQVTAPTVLGLNIGATSPGDVIALTGAQVGELVRFATLISDNTSSGSVGTYVLTSPTTTVEFKVGVGSTIEIAGFTTLDEGSEVVVCLNDNSATVVTFLYDDSGTTALERLRPPGNKTLTLYPGDSAKWRYFNQRWRCVSVAVQPTGRLLKVTHYTSGSGTHTFDARTAVYEAHIQDGGAAGGGVPSCTAGQSAAGGGGQAGAFAIVRAAPPGATASYAVGASVSGVSGSAGNNGNTSSFDGNVGGANANGGNAGTASAAARATQGGGDNVTGSQGDPGEAGFANGTAFAAGGKGGSGRYGGGGWGPITNTAANQAGAIGRKPGAGGSGAINVAIGGAQAGGGGAAGDIWVYEWS